MNFEERLTEKYLFDRQTAQEVCRAHYRARGISEELSHQIIDWLDDKVLEYVYKQVLEEQKNAQNKRDQVL